MARNSARETHSVSGWVFAEQSGGIRLNDHAVDDRVRGVQVPIGENSSGRIGHRSIVRVLAIGLTAGPVSRSRRRMPREDSPHLSKSKYCAGLQCTKRLWLGVNARGLAGVVDPAPQTLFDTGAEIGEKARKLFPGGVLVDESPWEHAAPLERTVALIGDPTGEKGGGKGDRPQLVPPTTSIS